jgi:hypothetical protein
MSSATATPFHSVESPRKLFPWRSHAILSSLFVAGCLAVRIQNYFAGRRFESMSAFSPQTWLLLFLFFFGLALIFAAIGGLVEMVRRREPWKKSGRLVLPFAATWGIAWLPIPDFIEAAAGSIREKASSEELTSLARSVADSPPAWLKEGSAGGHQSDKIKWMTNSAPLDRLGLGKYAFVQVRENTLQFYWGSSLSQRWGLAISATPGAKPVLPDDVVKATPVYPDVWVYSLIDY